MLSRTASWQSPSKYAVDDIARQPGCKWVVLFVLFALTPLFSFSLSFVVPRLYLVTTVSTTGGGDKGTGASKKAGSVAHFTGSFPRKPNAAPLTALNQFYAVTVAFQRAKGHEEEYLEKAITLDIRAVGMGGRWRGGSNETGDVVGTVRRKRTLVCPRGVRWCNNITLVSVCGKERVGRVVVRCGSRGVCRWSGTFCV